MDRLTRRNRDGGITVQDMSAALKRLADYEDRVERAEKILPLANIERVLRDGEWLDETYWDYIHWDCDPHD